MTDRHRTVEALLAGEGHVLPLALQALWHDAKGDWEAAHGCAQQQEHGDCAWVHAYLHRKEGDQWNAEYWYRRAGKPVFRGALDDEWRQIAEALLSARLQP